MLLIRTLFGLAAATVAAVAQAATSDWETLGLRVTPREMITQVGPRTMPFVVAVREGSPAFFAGVQPGDAISFIRCGRNTYNYFDQEALGGTYFRAYESAGREQPRLDLDPKDRCAAGLGALLSVAVPPDDARLVNKFLETRTAEPTAGQWLTAKADVAAKVGGARSSQGDNLAALYARAETELKVKPCSYDVNNPYDLQALPPLVQQIAAAARAAGTGDADLPFWRDVVFAYCDAEQKGPLPSFEVALHAMSTGNLDPCRFDAATVYSNPRLDVAARARPWSRSEFETITEFETLLAKASDAQRKCFFDVIRRAITTR